MKAISANLARPLIAQGTRWPYSILFACIIHDDSSPFDKLRVLSTSAGRNCQDAMRDGYAEPWEAEAYLKLYVEASKGEPVRLATSKPWLGLSQRRIGSCSRTVHE